MPSSKDSSPVRSYILLDKGVSHSVLNCTSVLDNTSPMATPTDHDCKESLLSDGDTEVGDADLELQHGGPTRRQIRLHWFWIAIVSTAVTTFFATRAYYTHPSRIERAAAADTFSPLYKDFKPRIEKVVLGGDLWGNKSNIFEQEPSPAVDEAWNEISTAKYMLVSKQDLIKMHGTLDTAVEWPDNPGEYFVEFHSYHLLHCLDVLRRNSYHNFPHY
ncbi:hypothetical protein SMMN14_04756 [Sphaerulina musiva]